MKTWRLTLWLLAVALADALPLWSAEPSIDRRGANQPILLGEFDTPQSAVNALKFMKDGNEGWRLFAAGQDKTVWQWAVRTHGKGQSIHLDPLERIRWPIDRGFRGQIFALATQTDESEPKLVAFGGDGERHFPTGVIISTVGSPERQQILNFTNGILRQEWVESTEFWPNATRLLAVGYRSSDLGNACIAIWDLDNPTQPQAILRTNFDSVDFLSISPDGRQLVAGTRQRPTLKLWLIEQIRPWKEGRSLEIQLPSFLTGLCWTDQEEFVAATYKHGVRRFRNAKPTLEMTEAAEVIVRNHTRRRITMSVTKGKKSVSTWKVDSNSQIVETSAEGDQLSLSEAGSELLTIPFALSRNQHFEFDIRPSPSPNGVDLSVVTATRNMVCQNGLLATIRDEFILSNSSKDSGKFRIRVACEPSSHQQQLAKSLEDSTFEEKRCNLALSGDGQFLSASGWKWRTTNSSLGQQAVQEIRVWRLSDGAQVAVVPDRRLPLNGLAQIQRVEVSRSQPKSSFPDVVRFDWLARNPAIAGETESKAQALSGFSLTANEALNDRVIDLNSPPPWGRHPNEVPQNWETRMEADRFWLTQSTPQRKEIGPIPHLEWFSQEVLCGHEFSHKNRRYVAIAYPAGILIWSLDRLSQWKGNSPRVRPQALVRWFYGNFGRVNCLSTSSAGDWLVSGASDGSICLWSLQGIDQPYDGRRELGIELRHESGRTIVKNVVEGLPAYFAGLRGETPSSQGDEITGLTIFTAATPDQLPAKLSVPHDQWDKVLRDLSPEEQVHFEVRGREGILGARIHREPLWTMYPMLDGQWVIATPSQVFGASSDEAMRRFGWHVNLNTEGHVELFPLDLFRERYDDVVSVYRAWQTQVPVVRNESLELPSLVEITDVLAGGQAVSPTAELPQSVELSVNLRVKQTSNEELQQLELWCNGALIQKSKLSAIGEPTQSPLPWIVPKDVLRVGDRNLLVAVVRSQIPGVQEDISLTNRAVRSFRVAGTAAPKLHFLGIGVTELQDESRFRNSETPIKPLEFSANDVCLLGEALAERGQASGFDLGEFQYLVSATPQGVDLKTKRVAKPTREQVLKSLDRLCQVADPNDFVWIAISCHGFNDYKDRSKAYMVVQDTKANLDNALTDTDLFEDRLYRLRAPALLLLDACHSGSALTGSTLRGLSGFGLGPEVLVSCKPNQLSYENPALRYDHGRWYGMSAFTASLVEALRGDSLSVSQAGTPTMISGSSNMIDRNGDGYFSIEELGLHAAARVPAIRRLAGGNERAALEPQQPDLLPSLAFPRRHIRFRIPKP